MPLQKFRRMEDMPRTPRLLRLDDAALRRIAGLWAFSSLAARRIYPRGIFKYRNQDEAQAARRALLSENIRRLREERESSDRYKVA